MCRTNVAQMKCLSAIPFKAFRCVYATYAGATVAKHPSGDCDYSDNASELWDIHHKAAAISRDFLAQMHFGQQPAV